MPPHPVCRPLFPACVQPEMSEVLKVRDAVLLLAANKGRQGVHEKKGLQQQMNSNLNNIQVSGDEEVRAALMQLLNDQSEAVSFEYGLDLWPLIFASCRLPVYSVREHCILEHVIGYVPYVFPSVLARNCKFFDACA
eukprot:1143456-Pelagomonas_calceolata.AAC.2